jgi:bifunctional DNA-binding transcriptional regulator/antitoxin component of YhaV-PrlF toxin-antitoxin module
MQNITISNTNSKGQLVIPQEMRKQLAISPNVPLQIMIRGNTIHITPIQSVLTLDDTQADTSYLEILKKTQGSWKDADYTIDEDKKKLELKASTARKKPW